MHLWSVQQCRTARVAHRDAERPRSVCDDAAARLFCLLEDTMAKRELIEPNPEDKRYVRRESDGQFKSHQDDVGKSLSQDRRRKAKTEAPKGQGDRGDRSNDSRRI
jgi:hypothetical protein